MFNAAKSKRDKTKKRPACCHSLVCVYSTGQKEGHIYDVGIFLYLEIKLKSQQLRVFNPKSFKANSKTIYKIKINNLQQSAYSLLTCLIIQSLIYILSSISWSRTVCTFSDRPTEHSNEFTLGGR